MTRKLKIKQKLQTVAAIVLIVNVFMYLYYSGTVRTGWYGTVAYSRAVAEVRDTDNDVSNIAGLPVCKANSSNLRSDVSPEKRLAEVEKNPSILKQVKPGGVYTSPNCKSEDNIAIIVPFRDRTEHLVIFLRHMHSFLQKQQIPYRIFFIELTYKSQFNRALLMNAGFAYASNITNFSCYIFHDVDLLPTNEFNFYNCSGATHLSSNNSKYGYKLFYKAYFGGVVGFSEEAFRSINGCSNLFYGWGKEDDDLIQRVFYKIPKQFDRKPLSTGVYKALEHTRSDFDEKKLVNRGFLTTSSLSRMHKDGLNTLNITFVKTENRDLYTWVLVDVDEAYEIKKYKEMLTQHKFPSIPAIDIRRALQRAAPI